MARRRSTRRIRHPAERLALLVCLAVVVGCGERPPPAVPTPPVEHAVSPPPAVILEEEAAPAPPPALPTAPTIDVPTDDDLRALPDRELLELTLDESAFLRFVAKRTLATRRVSPQAIDPDWVRRLVVRQRELRSTRFETAFVDVRFVPSRLGTSLVTPLVERLRDPASTDEDRAVIAELLRAALGAQESPSATLRLLAEDPSTARWALDVLRGSWDADDGRFAELVRSGCFEHDLLDDALEDATFRARWPRRFDAAWIDESDWSRPARLSLVKPLVVREELALAFRCLRAATSDSSMHRQWLESLADHRDPEILREVALTCGFVGVKALPLGRRLLGSDDPRIARAALRSLTQLGAAAEPALDDALARIRSGAPLATEAAIWRLAEDCGRRDELLEAAVPQVVAGLDDPDAAVRSETVMLVSDWEITAPAVLEALQRRLLDADPDVRWTALRRGIDVPELAKDPQALRRMTDGFLTRATDNDRDALVTARLLHGWSEIGDVPDDLKRHAGELLDRGEMRPHAASLARALVESRVSTPDRMLDHLETRPELAAVALAPLVAGDALSPTQRTDRSQRLRRWTGIATDGPPALVTSPAVRAAALDALASLGGVGPDDAPWLVEQLRHDDVDVRCAVARALGGLADTDVDGERIVAHLTARFVQGTYRELVAAAEAIGRYGDAGRSALPYLARIARDDEVAAAGVVAFGAEGFEALARTLPDKRAGSGWIENKQGLGDIEFTVRRGTRDRVDPAFRAPRAAFWRAWLAARYGPTVDATTGFPDEIPDRDRERLAWVFEQIREGEK